VSRLYGRLTVAGAAATQHERWEDVDALRAVAALSVLAAHSFLLGGSHPPAQSAASYAVSNAIACGVWLFFAISGFLIAGPFLTALVRGGPLPPIGRFAVRRAARILPAYWVALAAILILVTGNQIMHFWQVPVHALLLQSLVPNETQRLYFVAWTLGVEAVFYALVPLGAVLVRRARGARPLSIDRVGAVLTALWAFSVVWGIALSLAHPFGPTKAMPAAFTVLYLVPPLGNFCPGMLVFLALTPEGRSRGGWWERGRQLCASPAKALSLAAVCWLLSQKLHWQSDPLAFALFYPLVGVASGLALGSVLSGKWLTRVREALAPVGLVSYGIYLWHWVILAVLLDHHIYPVSSFGGPASVIHAIVLLVLTLPVALLSWLVIERPLLRRTTLWDRGGGQALRRAARAAPDAERPDPSAAAAAPAARAAAAGDRQAGGPRPAGSRSERPAARS